MTLEEMLAEAGITEMEIMRYADGVLAPERRPVVRAALAKYPELMQLLESFLFTRGPLVEAYDEVLDAPIPARIMKLVQPRRRACLLPRLGQCRELAPLPGPRAGVCGRRAGGRRACGLADELRGAIRFHSAGAAGRCRPPGAAAGARPDADARVRAARRAEPRSCRS